jgi:hypothetical protein
MLIITVLSLLGRIIHMIPKEEKLMLRNVGENMDIWWALTYGGVDNLNYLTLVNPLN